MIVNAFQWAGEREQEGYPSWFKEAIENKRIYFEKGHLGNSFISATTGPTTVIIIKTLEGDMLALAGDYVIKGIESELYPCKSDIFKKTYELAKTPHDCKHDGIYDHSALRTENGIEMVCLRCREGK